MPNIDNPQLKSFYDISTNLISQTLFRRNTNYQFLSDITVIKWFFIKYLFTKMSNIRFVSALGVILVLLSISMVIFDDRPKTIAITVMSILISVLLIIGTWKNSRKILLIWHILAWIQCFCYPFLLRRDELTGEA